MLIGLVIVLTAFTASMCLLAGDITGWASGFLTGLLFLPAFGGRRWR